jgi:hypothetical protein
MDKGIEFSSISGKGPEVCYYPLQVFFARVIE